MNPMRKVPTAQPIVLSIEYHPTIMPFFSTAVRAAKKGEKLIEEKKELIINNKIS